MPTPHASTAATAKKPVTGKPAASRAKPPASKAAPPKAPSGTPAAKAAPARQTASAAPAKARASAKPASAKPAAAKPVAQRAAPRATLSRKPAASATAPLSPEQRYKMVQEAAYFLAERNGFAGDSADYWAAAEAQIGMMLSGKMH